MNPLKELAELAPHLPLTVLQDIDKRITDWRASGGELSDDYVVQQLNYAKRVFEHLQKEKGGQS